jgi:hypothetical protein
VLVGCLADIEASPWAGGYGPIGVFFRQRVIRMRAERREALVDFLLEAVADEHRRAVAPELRAARYR